jgi:hypothetical protein
MAAALDSAIESGFAWLLAAQDKDGGWHSETYGAMRGGAAITSLVLYAASHLREDLRAKHRKQLERGYAFLTPGLKKQGTIACPDGSLDFPVYAAALVLTAARRMKLGATEGELNQLTTYLIESQLAEARKFKPGDKHFGGWDLMGNSPVLGLTSDTNVSLAVHALEALRGEKSPAGDRARSRALEWLAGCQNLPRDGGFAFSPDGASLNNKAEWTDKEQTKPRSYGTATCDGLRALTYAGVKWDDKRSTVAVTWLAKWHSLSKVPGFEKLPEENDWKHGLLYYYYSTFAKAVDHFPARVNTEERRALGDKIVGLQQKDGSWQNDSSRMREDDPLIATSLALVALGHVQRHWNAGPKPSPGL